MKDEKLKRSFENAQKKSECKIRYLRNCVVAFLVGGSICVLGEVIKSVFLAMDFGVSSSVAYETIILIFIAAVLTCLGVYDKIGSFSGAGSIVPITGFSNSIVSSAMEFKSEGYIFGVGAKMFNIAGPVLVYGTILSWVYGVIYYFVGALS